MPRFIAIVGPSGSGKSRLAQQLTKEFSRHATALSLDHFYQDFSHLPEKERHALNYDEPQTIDWNSLEQTLTILQKGQTAHAPQYDFKTHTRRKTTLAIKPSPLIIVEGPWLLLRPALCELFSLSLFVHCPVSLCLQRRLNRDIRERDRTETFAITQFEQQVLPMSDLHIRPQIAQADLVITTPPTSHDREILSTKLQELLDEETIENLF